MKIAIILILSIFIGVALWSCPSRKIIPDPTPPQPQMSSPIDGEGETPPVDKGI